jgi:CPA2 family monovalent cation:H+ antiporter-2
LGLGFALALSSTALVLPMAGTSGPVGQRAFGMLLFEDLALVPIIFALGAMAPHAGGGAAAEIGRTLLLGGLVIVVLLLIGRLALPPLFAQAARTKSPELFLAASLLVVILASVATSAVGLSPIVGALLAGILIAETDYHGEVEHITEPFKGLALGVFLITVGMSLDFDAVAHQWLPLLIAVLMVVAVKALVTSLLLKLGGTPRGVALEIGLMMAAPGETTLIVLATSSAAGLIGPATAAFWQIVTAIGLTITPLLASLGRVLARKLAVVEAEPIAHEEVEGDRALIIGFGRVGRLVAQMMAAHKLPYLGLDADPDTVRKARDARLSGCLWRHQPSGHDRSPRFRSGERRHSDDGRSRAGRAAHQGPAQAPSRPYDRRPRTRSEPRRSSLSRGRDRCRAGDDRILAATVRGGAVRSRPRGGAGYRLDPREAGAASQQDHGDGGDGA